MKTQLELIKEVKSKINNRVYRVRKIFNHYIIDYKVDLGYRYCCSTYSKKEMENNFTILLNQKLF